MPKPRHNPCHYLTKQAELSLAKVDAAGVIAERASIGWAALPLFDGGGGGAGEGGRGGTLSAASVVAGSPRYLLYR